MNKGKLGYIAAIVLLIICIWSGGITSAQAAGVTLNKSKVSIAIGETTKLELVGTKKAVTWRTANKKIASVDEAGVVTGLSDGTVNISASISGQDYTCKVTVKNATISEKNITLDIRAYKKLSIKGSNAKVTWSTDNKSIATVSSDGFVRAKKEGTATIQAKIKNKILTCSVTVKKCKLNQSSLNMELNSSFQLNLDGAKETPSWTTYDENVVKVTSDGTVKGVGIGETEVIASLNGLEYTCYIIVSKDELIINNTRYDINFQSYDTIYTNIDSSKLTFSSEDTTIAKVDKDGKIYGAAPGATKISIQYKNETYTVNVYVDIYINDINMTDSFMFAKGETNTVAVSSKAYDLSSYPITYTSDDPSIATVDNTGKVTAIEKGSTTITAHIGNILTKTCIVDVNDLRMRFSEKYVFLGDSTNLYLEGVTVDQAAMYQVVSNDPSVVEIVKGEMEGQYKITMKEKGEYKITASNGTVSSTVTIYSRLDPVQAVKNKYFVGYTGEVKEALENAADIVDSCLASCTSDEEKIAYVYNYITHNMTYNYDEVSTPLIEDYGNYCFVRPLVNHTGVCEGFSLTFSLLMESMDIKCYITTGIVEVRGPHAWNRVYINGVWKYLDVTFALGCDYVETSLSVEPLSGHIYEASCEPDFKIQVESYVHFTPSDPIPGWLY